MPRTDYVLECSLCGAKYAPQDILYVCPQDGGNLTLCFDSESLRARISPRMIFDSPDPSLWRYLPLLPVGDPGGEGTPLRAVGRTPTYASPRLRQLSGLPKLWLKDESRNPTASFKDRASAVVVARAREIGAQVIVTASTGNAGAALAGMAAAVGQKAVIFAPRSAPPAKVAQLLVFGAQVILVDGNYDQAFDLTIEASQAFGWYCRNTGYNPFTVEGKKTAAFELWEDVLRHFSPALPRPPAVFVSVGDGNIITGIHKGFTDLLALGWLEQLPRLFAVQAEGSAAIANAIRSGSETVVPVHAETLADSICVDLPRDGLRAVRAVTQTGGKSVLVSDEAILQAIAVLGQTGIFAEPAGATAYAGALHALQQGWIEPEDPVLVINTGSGLKDVRAAMLAVKSAPIIEPTLTALQQHLSSAVQ